MPTDVAVATLAANVANLAIELARLGRGQEMMMTAMSNDRVADAREHGEVNERLARVEEQLHAAIRGQRKLEEANAILSRKLDECTDLMNRKISRNPWLRRAVHVGIGIGSAAMTYWQTHKH